MREIELGDYEYFKSLLIDSKYTEWIIYFMQFSSEKEELKDLLERREELELSKESIKLLIKSVNDSQYTDYWIKRREKLGFETYDVIELIESIGNSEYTDKYIKKRIDLGLSQSQIILLIKETRDPKYINKCIDMREELALDKYSIISLIQETGYPECIDKCIEEREKLELDENNFRALIERIKDFKSIEKCIEKREKLGLKIDDILYLLSEKTVSKYIFEFIEKRETLKLSQYDIKVLIEKIRTQGTIDRCIEMKEELGLKKDDIVLLINNIGEFEHTDKYIKRRREFGFDKDDIIKLCDNFSKKEFLNKFFYIIDQLEEEEYYEEFIKNYLGEVELDKKTNRPMILEEIEKIIFNPRDEEIAEKIKSNLLQIISKWEQIKEQIQYKKANSIKNNGLEIKLNADEIVLAIQVLNRRSPNNISEVEFENTPGSEKVGTDTKYTKEPENAVERAYELSKKMNEAKCEKKYPDFSVEDEDISLKVLHPQDKSAILLGYETNCCFRPNGTADGEAKTEYSLLQYCTMTPYGGVMRVESKDGEKVYMGSPILRSGNCLMFHSYESNSNKKTEQVNELLDKAAIRAIEGSDGNIKAVFSTDLHTGKEKLDIEKRLTISSFFKAYTEEEYSNYNGMYTNLDSKNVVLAINIDGKILTGEEVKEWFEKECNGDEKVFIEKLGLQLGKVEENYEYIRRNIYQEIAIDNFKLVGKFNSRYQELKDERNKLALVNKKKKLESKNELNEDEKEELIIIDEELEQYKGYEEYIELSVKDIRERLAENREKSFEVFSGEDIYLIAEHYGITAEEIEKIVTEKVTMQYERIDITSEESSKSKKIKGKIISQIKECNDSKLIKLISKVAKEEITEEELKLLQEAGIETREYESICIKKEGTVDSEKIKADRIKGQVKKILADESAVESIVADKIFSDISEEEINAQILEDLIKTIKSHVYDYYVSQNPDGIMTEYEKERINERIHGLDIDDNITKCIETDFKPIEWIERIKKEFGLDVKSEYNKILRNQAKLRSKVQRNKLEKLKSDITIGIRKKERIDQLRDSISQGDTELENKEFERIIYGNDWFIGFNSGEPTFYIDPSISEENKEDLKEVLKKEIEKEREKNSENRSKTISIEEMKEAVSKVPLEDKAIAVKMLEEMLKELENGERK